MSETNEKSKALLEQLLGPDNIVLLRADAARWRQILEKKTVNVLIVAPRPDKTIDTSRRDGLARMLLIVEELLAQYDRATATEPVAGGPGLGDDPAALKGG